MGGSVGAGASVDVAGAGVTCKCAGNPMNTSETVSTCIVVLRRQRGVHKIKKNTHFLYIIGILSQDYLMISRLVVVVTGSRCLFRVFCLVFST